MQVQDEPYTIGKIRCCQLHAEFVHVLHFVSGGLLLLNLMHVFGSQIQFSLLQSSSLQSSISDTHMPQQLFALVVGKQCDSVGGVIAEASTP